MLENLLSDWFGERSEDSYVHRSEQHRTGWDEKLKSGYSQYLVGSGQTALDVLKVAYKLCKNRLAILLPGKNVPLSFRGKDSFTNGRNIVISTSVVDEKGLSVYEQLDVLLGLLTHEVAHILHTDFSVNFVRDKFQKTILNILEDERIEYHIGEAFPGYGAYLEKLKAYYFDFKHTKKDFSSPYAEVFDCFFKLVRFPKHVEVALVEKHLEFLTQVKACITPYPLDFNSTHRASIKIADLFEQYFKDQVEQEKQKGKANPDHEEDEKDSDNSTSETSVADRMEVESELMDILDQIADTFKDLETTSATPGGAEESEVFQEIPLAEEIIKGEVEFNPSSKLYVTKAENATEQYQDIKTKVLSQARSLSSAIRMDLQPKEEILTGLRSGKLDEAKLVDAVFGRPTVYSQRNQSEVPTISVVLMIDESGSMGGEKIGDAKQVAVLFTEALKLVPKSKLFVYGFTSDYDEDETDTITIYKEPGFDRTCALGSVKAKRNNRDGRCIRGVVDRVKKFNPGKCLLFVISDGQPAGYLYQGVEAINDTREAVQYAEKSGFLPIQVGIKVNTETQEAMFDRYVNYQSSHQMVQEMKKLLRKSIRTMVPACVA